MYHQKLVVRLVNFLGVGFSKSDLVYDLGLELAICFMMSFVGGSDFPLVLLDLLDRVFAREEAAHDHADNQPQRWG